MKLVEINTPEKSDEVHGLIKKDGHEVPCVSHTMEDSQGRIYGAFSACYAPVLFLWMDSNQHNPLAAFRAYMLIEKMWKANGHKRILICINPESPFYKWTEKARFQSLGWYELMTKQLS